MKINLSTERYYWQWLWRAGLPTTRLHPWQAGFGFMMCLLGCLFYIRPYALENNTTTFIVIPHHEASISALEQLLAEEYKRSSVLRVDSTSLLQGLKEKTALSEQLPTKMLPDILTLSFRKAIFTPLSTSLILKQLSENKAVARVIVSQKNETTLLLLQMTTSFLLIIMLMGSFFWTQSLWQQLTFALQQFLTETFPASLIPSATNAYRKRIAVFIILCLCPPTCILVNFLSWVV